MEQVHRLLIAAKNGNLAVLKELLDRGIHVDSGGEEGRNALHMAAANDRQEAVRFLLTRGASLEAQTSYGWTALMLAAYYGHLRVTLILLRHTGNVHSKNQLGATALYCAARSGHVQVVAHLLEFGAAVNRVPQSTGNPSDNNDYFGVSPLMTAAQHGHEEVVTLLIERGANVNYQEPSTGWTALMLAALNGRMGVVEILTANGSDISKTNFIKQTALHVASSRQNNEVVRFLDRRTINRDVHSQGPRLVKPSIMELAKNGDVQGLKSLLQGGDGDQLVNARDDEGATPLMYAAMRGHFSVAQLLIDHKSDIDYQEKISGWTALMQATYYRHKSVVKLLIDSGADVRIRAANGCTAFDMASIIGDTEILRLVASASMQTPPLSDTNLSLSSLSDTRKNYSSYPIPTSKQNKANGYESDVTETYHKTWWSKVSGRFRNIRRTKLRVLEPGMASHVCEVLTPEELAYRYEQGVVTGETDLMVSKRSLTSVLDSAIKVNGHNLRRPKALAAGSQRAQLPDDVITPVVPPSIRTATFELTRVQQREQSSPDVDVTNLPVPSLCINGKTIPGVSERYHLGSLDNISSVSGNIANRRRESLSSRGSSRGHSFTGSPDSSYSSASATSSNSGSKTLKASSTTATDIFLPTGSAANSSLRQRSGRDFFSPSPTLVSSSSIVPRSNQRSPASASSLHSPGSTGRLHYQHSMDSSKDYGNEESLPEILEQLSLEKYNPIFEEQEIDMEAFLTLNDGDLLDLGVTQKGAREQILATVAELSSGKDRERQQFEDTFKTDKSQLTSGYGSVSPSNSFDRYMNMPRALRTPP